MKKEDGEKWEREEESREKTQRVYLALWSSARTTQRELKSCVELATEILARTRATSGGMRQDPAEWVPYGTRGITKWK